MTKKSNEAALRAGPQDTALARRYSLLFALLLALGMLHFALLPGLLGACLGFLAAKALVRIGQRWRFGPNRAFAAAVVIVLPLLALVLALLNAKALALGAMGQYQALLQFLAQTVLEIRSSRVRGYPLSPLTPPYVRFRIRRFKWDAGGAGGLPPARPARVV